MGNTAHGVAKVLLRTEPSLEVPTENLHPKLQVDGFDEKGLKCFITDPQVVKQQLQSVCGETSFFARLSFLASAEDTCITHRPGGGSGMS